MDQTNKYKAIHKGNRRCIFVFAGSVIVAGGFDDKWNKLNTVEYLPILEQMEIEKWKTSTHLLPYKMNEHSCVTHSVIAVISGG